VIRVVARLAILGLGVGWGIERLLRMLAGDAPPPPVESLIVIDAPIERVWSVVADIEGQPRWMHDMKSVRMLTPGPVGVGTRGESTIRMLGISVNDPVMVTEFQPPTRFAIRHDGRVSGRGLITLERGADGTTTIVRWSEHLVLPAFPHLGAALAGPVFGRIFQADLEHLRDLIEA
jgi:uncharacterized membrane protein